MAQQSQPVVPFNALKPATWGSLKLLPLALRSRLTGGKGSDDGNRVGFGKENIVGQPAGLQAPPKLGDLSHLHAAGPRRSVNQRYVLQPNLNVSRPILATHAPGLSGLLLPGMAPIITHQSQQQQELVTIRHQTPLRPRSSTPSSPSLRGRQPYANPNFAPPTSNISTRLPTPVRINASPGPSPTSVAPMLPKPPSPSRSLSQGGAPLANPFASLSASPLASTTANNTFMLPTPPSILGNVPSTRVNPSQQQQYHAAAPRSTLSPAPWASGAAQSNTTPTSVRPSPPALEPSILASLQLPNQQQRSAGHSSSVVGASASVAAIPGHSEWLAPVAAPAPSAISPVLSAPVIQAALQQALQGAVERKPDAFRVDDFERFFDSMMHPGDVGKLDGPLPLELADDIRYSDVWYKHCRDWNAKNKPAIPYSAPASAAPETPMSCRLESTTFVVEQPEAATRQRQRQHDAQVLEQPWNSSEITMSDACCKALDIAHHGLRKVLTPTSESRSVFNMTQMTDSAAVVHGGSAPPSLLQHQPDPRTQHMASTSTEVEHRVAPQRADVLIHIATVVSNDLRALERDQATAPVGCDGSPKDEDPGHIPAVPLGASNSTTSRVAGVHGAEDSGSKVSTDVASMPAVNTALPPTGCKFSVPMLLLSNLDAPLLPRAAGAMLSPAPDSARPPSTAATTPCPRTPAADSSATGATTPVGKDDATTPTTATARANATVSPFFESTTQVLTSQETGSAAAMPFRRLSRSLELAAVESITDLPEPAPQPQGGRLQPLQAVNEQMAPVSSNVEPVSEAAATIVVWSPGFPPPAPTAAAHEMSGAVLTESTATVVHPRPPSPVTLLLSAPPDMPTPNPVFFNSGCAAAPGVAPSSMGVAVSAVLAPGQASDVAVHSSAGPPTSTTPSAANPLKDLVVDIEKLSTLKQSILAEDKEVDVTSITKMIQLKLAVEQLLARTSSAVQTAGPSQAASVATPRGAPSTSAIVSASLPHQLAGSVQNEHADQATTPKKQSRTATFGAFLKSVFSPRSASVSKAQASTAAAAASAAASSSVVGGGDSNAAGSTAAIPASPSTTVVGIQAPRPVSASALPRQAASPSLADKSRHTTLHKRAATRLAEAVAEPAGTQPAQNAVVGGATQAPRRGVWQRYEEKIALHRHQLDTTKAQLDEAVQKLNDMQAEFDELLLCLGMESAKNKALCDAMRAAGLDPEPILAAIEEQWMSGVAL